MGTAHATGAGCFDVICRRSLTWLQPDDQAVRLSQNCAIPGIEKISCGRSLKVMMISEARWRASCRPDIERHACPAPVINRQLHRNKGFRG